MPSSSKIAHTSAGARSANLFECNTSRITSRSVPVSARGWWRSRCGVGAGRSGTGVILDVLHSNRFADLAPAEVWAILLDEGIYLGSESTFYRLLRAAGESRER